MTWEEKFEALKALGNTSLRMRKPGHWYVEPGGRCIRDGPLGDGAYGEGSTPQAAIEDDWSKIAEGGELIECSPWGGPKQLVRWNGYMWVSSS